MADDSIALDHVSSWQFDAWAAFMQSICEGDMDIRFEQDKRACFTGWARPIHLFGLSTLDHGANGVRMERTARHVRLCPDDYTVSLLLTGHCIACQDDGPVTAVPGDLIMFDTTRPAWRLDDGRMVTLKLPRKFVISALGYEPRNGILSRGTLAGRLISQLVAAIIQGEHTTLAPGDNYMRTAIYDLLGAAFARPDGDPRSGASHTDRLFAQVCSIIRDGIADPDLTPSKVAAEAGISLRYLQKLFTPKGTTCVHFIHALRLDQAARLLRRRSMLAGKLPLSEIAFASGFRDYTFFARKFRERFGCVPSAYTGRD